ncbi:hypothetical protein KFL_000090710, partial [Klebsormidium nitens]
MAAWVSALVGALLLVTLGTQASASRAFPEVAANQAGARTLLQVPTAAPPEGSACAGNQMLCAVTNIGSFTANASLLVCCTGVCPASGDTPRDVAARCMVSTGPSAAPGTTLSVPVPVISLPSAAPGPVPVTTVTLPSMAPGAPVTIIVVPSLPTTAPSPAETIPVLPTTAPIPAESIPALPTTVP